MNNDRRTSNRPDGLRTAILAGLLFAAPMLLTSCASPSATAPVTVVTSTSDATVTQTATVTNTAETTRTAEVTRTTSTTPAGGGGDGGGTTTSTPTTSGGGGGSSTSTPESCPDAATLGAVTPNYDPQYPVSAINCGGEWAVGTYEADGKNQTTGIWRNSGGGWAYQDRAAICATADNLPDELYAQACQGN